MKMSADTDLDPYLARDEVQDVTAATILGVDGVDVSAGHPDPAFVRRGTKTGDIALDVEVLDHRFTPSHLHEWSVRLGLADHGAGHYPLEAT
jgi:hypothetical protein